jgi:hypothetical protein
MAILPQCAVCPSPQFSLYQKHGKPALGSEQQFVRGVDRPPYVRYCPQLGTTMHEETRRFVSRMLHPIVAEFKREVAKHRANGASEADIQEMLYRLNP